MNKFFKYYALLWVIFFAVFNVICFVIPNKAFGMSKFGGSFWVGYIFVAVAFISQLAATYFASNQDKKSNFFFNIPIIQLSFYGLILTIIFGSLCMVIPNFPIWITVIVCLLILALTASITIKATAAADMVGNIDKKTKNQTFFVKSLTMDADSLRSRASSTDAKEACRKVYEALCYSDPMSNDALANVESQITLKFNEFSNAISDNTTNIGDLANELVILINDRNKKCKLLK